MEHKKTFSPFADRLLGLKAFALSLFAFCPKHYQLSERTANLRKRFHISKCQGKNYFRALGEISTFDSCSI